MTLKFEFKIYSCFLCDRERDALKSSEVQIQAIAGALHRIFPVAFCVLAARASCSLPASLAVILAAVALLRVGIIM